MIRPSLLATLCLTLAAQERPVLVQNVRIFDGERVLKADSVRFAQGRIQEIGRGLAPKGAEVVDGSGHTLLPGLIDSHVHVFGNALGQSLSYGVTTVIDCFTDPEVARQAKARASKSEADLLSSGHLATTAGGHGAQFGIPVPTLSRAEEAAPWVKARLAEGSDFIKIIREDGSTHGMRFTTLGLEVVEALTQAAHAHGKLAVAHVVKEADALACLERGVNGLAHAWGDAVPGPRTTALLKEKGRFVIPTLSVFQAGAPEPLGARLAKDAALRPYLPLEVERNLVQPQAWQKATATYHSVAAQGTGALHRAGVTLLAGTDAPNPGTAFGISLHGELELLVKAGLSPVEALKAATVHPATTFRMTDRGRVQVGTRADLLLVKGDPTVDITATRAIARIWKQGEALDRAPIAAGIAQARTAAAQAAPTQGPVRWTFTSDADLATWMPSTDAIAGGASTVKLARHPEGGLHLTGKVDGKVPFAWAGALWMPTGDFMAGKDFRTLKAHRFRATGPGAPALMFYPPTRR